MTPANSHRAAAAVVTSLPSKPAVSRIARFAITRELGRGRVGCVYLAHDPIIGRQVALKTFNPRLTLTERSRYAQEFINEARAAGCLSHPSIVTVYDACHEGDLVYVAMEYLEGEELSRMLERGHRFRADEVATVGWRIADALDHAHRHEVIHRDIKPANIFMTGDNQPKIVDFGIARFPHRLGESAADSTNPATLYVGSGLLGTPNYMSPEQASGKAVDARTDIYSLGAVMYEMLTGRKPFQADDVGELLEQIASSSPPPPHKLNPQIPAYLSAIVMRAMSKQRDKRYTSAEKMALELKRFLLQERKAQRRMKLPIAALEQSAREDDAPHHLKRFWAGYLALSGAAAIAVWLLFH